MEDEHRFCMCDRVLAVLREAVRTGLTSSADLGARLDLAPGTIDRYFSDAIQTLGLRSRAEVVLYAVREGLVCEAAEAPCGDHRASACDAPDPQECRNLH